MMSVDRMSGQPGRCRCETKVWKVRGGGRRGQRQRRRYGFCRYRHVEVLVAKAKSGSVDKHSGKLLNKKGSGDVRERRRESVVDKGGDGTLQKQMNNEYDMYRTNKFGNVSASEATSSSSATASSSAFDSSGFLMMKDKKQQIVHYIGSTTSECLQLGRKYATDPVVGIAAVLGAILAFGLQNLYYEVRYRLLSRNMNQNQWLKDQMPNNPGTYYRYSPFSSSSKGTGLVVYEGDQSESVEWVNSFIRKIWRVYQLNLERWFRRLLSPVINNGATKKKPKLIRSLTVEKFILDHEPPLFYNLSRRTSRKDSDLNCVVDVRYTGGAQMLMLLETAIFRVRIPVEVTDFDVDAQMWLKVRLAPLVPYVGTISAAFVREPNIRVELSPYSRVPLMRMPIIQDFLTKLLTKDLPRLMVLPQRLDINIPPALTAVAEAAIGRDAVSRAVATAVVQSNNSDVAQFWFNQLTTGQSMIKQAAAGGISLPDTYTGELTVLVREARYLRVGGVRGLLDVSDPYCVCVLGTQSVESRRSRSTGDMNHRKGHPVWNQEFQFLVQDKGAQKIHVSIKDSRLTLKPMLGYQMVPLANLEDGRAVARWVKLAMPSNKRNSNNSSTSSTNSASATSEKGAFGRRFLPRRQDPEILLELTYKVFDDDEQSVVNRNAYDSNTVTAHRYPNLKRIRGESESGSTSQSDSESDSHVKSSEKDIVDIRSAVKATRQAAALSAQSAARVRHIVKLI